MQRIKFSEPKSITPCLICGEYVTVNCSDDAPKICSECRRAVLAIRKQYKIVNVKLPEEN